MLLATSATQKVTFVDTPHGKTANCVVYRPTKYQDIRPIGDLWSLFPSSAAGECAQPPQKTLCQQRMLALLLLNLPASFSLVRL